MKPWTVVVAALLAVAIAGIFVPGIFIVLLFSLPLAVPLVALIILMRIREKPRGREPAEAGIFCYDKMFLPLSLRTCGMTMLMLLTLCATYALELAYAVTPGTDPLTLSIKTLYAMGGMNYGAVVSRGDWYRLFTGPLLHLNFGHLMGNAIGLLFAGTILESQLGRGWYLAIYFAGTLGDSLLSLVLVNGRLIAVGASGAIMGLFAALLIMSFHPVNRRIKTRLRILSLFFLATSILPGETQDNIHINYAAHLGGLIGGGICTGLMFIYWPRDAVFPRGHNLALLLAGLGILATLAGAFEAWRHYAHYAAV